MGSLGNQSTLPDYFLGKLGPRQFADPINRLETAADNWVLNPEYYSNKKGYNDNCALVSTAAALYAMGYDVEAMPRDTVWRGFDTVFEVDYSNPSNYIAGTGTKNSTGIPRASRLWSKYNNVSEMPVGAKAASKAIEDKVKSWGSGSFGVMNVVWKNSNSAHVVNIFNKNGRVIAYDFQINKEIKDLQAYLKRTVAKSTAIARLDNATVKTHNLSSLGKMVKKGRLPEETKQVVMNYINKPQVVQVQWGSKEADEQLKRIARRL